ncbi:hypothetical protein Q1695_007154 [Nippostrongylus brasiliensis]|nr:hypothetical protein Q1695_007154 [Nippostrongylus brasiliensis]
MNIFSFAAIALLYVIVAVVNARSVIKRQAGSNSYGDELSVPPTLAPYEAVMETTYATVPAEEPAPMVENVAPVVESAVVDSGYRAKRQAGSNTYGDELAVPAPTVVEPVEAVELPVEQEPQTIPSEEMPANAVAVVQSGY